MPLKIFFLNGTDFENLKAMFEQMYDHNNIRVFRKVTLLEQALCIEVNPSEATKVLHCYCLRLV